MQYLGLAMAVAFLALIVVLVALRLLLGGQWLLGWLRGTFGLAVLALGSLIGVIAYDVHNYRPLPDTGPVVTLTFNADGAQRYDVRLVQGNDERRVTLEGDLWQLDMRILRWKGLAELIGLEPGYRLDRLSARYLAVEQQGQARHALVSLSESPLGLDFWRWLRLAGRDLYLVDSEARRVNYMPIANGAVFQVNLAPTGLMVQPMNPAATQALKDW
ncbi:hypothetical protein [Stutzerimonas azotifigens]|uniref:Cation/multidrug efflux pump n=1 Tax=Stutzerimonas azotifigens TaxID=291995 RepID=A0ABR5Z4C2_9GAMM|nr:hypothetical protein [Stutzerimonas azotifigens]MBA1275051.1 hypothetical protein [Stutzerimonas azotifigens]